MGYTKRMLGRLAWGAALLATSAASWAQASWPTKPVRIVIPFGVGGGSDVAARLVAQDLSARWGQQVIVDNKPGADTVIAAAEVQRAAPDGHTLLMTISSTLTLTPHTMAKVPYHPINDFSYIGQMTEVPLLVMVNDGLPVKNFGEFIDYARANPGKVNAGGAATLSQLLTEQVSRATGTKMTWVMYKSGAEITRALLSKEVEFGVDAPTPNIAHIQSGKIKALAINTPARLSSMPDVPTLQELGVRGPMVALQHVMLAPRGLDAAILAKIQRDVQASLATPALREKMLANGLQATWRDGAEVVKSVQAQSVAIGEMVRNLGLSPQ